MGPKLHSTCADFSAGWVVSQALGLGCATETKFFDMKTLDTSVSESTDAAVLAACCTPFEDALCSDWQLIYGVCTSGTFVGSNAAASDGSLTAGAYQTACCDGAEANAAALTCADFSAGWVVSQALGLGCATETKFFDGKTLDTSVSESTDAAVLAACCTPFEDALCSDWQLIYGVCSEGNFWKSNAAPSDGTLTKEGYETACCSADSPPLTCADYSAGWVISQALGLGCATETKFFDLKTLDTSVSEDTDAAVMAACCTPFEDALCSDWQLNYGVCTAGTFVGSNAAASDGTLTAGAYQTACCDGADANDGADAVANGWSTKDGDPCVECDYKGTVFSKCTKLDANYAWCCTQSEYENSAASGTWAQCDAEATGDAPSGSNAAALTCADFSAAWLIAQALGQGCTQENKFFDLKTYDASVSESTDAAVLAACCTPFEDALCSDWELNYGVCSEGNLWKSNAAPSDGSLTKEGYEAACCSDDFPPSTCADYSVIWAGAQLLGLGCATEQKFFDLKTLSKSVLNSTDSAVLEACCTPFEDAVCSDWLLSCESGTFVQAGTSLAGQGDEGTSTPTATVFQDTCCSADATCANFEFSWIVAQALNQGCAQTDHFFDTKKSTNAVSSPNEDSSIIDACCTPFADALCSDWRLVNGACQAGAFTSTNDAPADVNNRSLSAASYESLCCISAHSITWGITVDVDKSDYEGKEEKYENVFRRACEYLTGVHALQIGVTMTLAARRLDARRLADLNVEYAIKINDADAASTMSDKLSGQTAANVTAAIDRAKSNLGVSLTIQVNAVAAPQAVETSSTGTGNGNSNEEDADSAISCGPMKYLAMIVTLLFCRQ